MWVWLVGRDVWLKCETGIWSRSSVAVKRGAEEAAWAGERVCMHFFERANGIRTRHTEGAFNASCPKRASFSSPALNQWVLLSFGYWIRDLEWSNFLVRRRNSAVGRPGAGFACVAAALHHTWLQLWPAVLSDGPLARGQMWTILNLSITTLNQNKL